jgi:lysozyme
MARKVNSITLAHIKASEGLRLNAYPDPGSINGEPWTVGYGSTIGVHKGLVITEAEAEARLVDDLTGAENTVSKLVTVPLNENQFGALVSLAFNIGATAFAKSTLLRKLNAGDYAAVPSQLQRWDKNDGHVMSGLTKRRAAEAKLWNTPAAAPAPTPLPSAPLPVTPRPEATSGRGVNLWPLLGLALAVAAVIYLVFIKR